MKECNKNIPQEIFYRNITQPGGKKKVSMRRRQKEDNQKKLQDWKTFQI